MRWGCLILLLALGTGPARADERNVQSIIQAAYDKACLAAHYKYLDGIVNMRAKGYHSSSPSGPVDPAEELQMLDKSMANATTVSETTTITQFVQLSASLVRVRIKDVMEFGQSHVNGRPRPSIVIRSVADDTWVLENGTWKIQSDEVREQNVDNQ